MAQPKRKTESRRAARRQAGRRVPVSNVAGRLVIMLALVAAVVFGVAVFFKVSRVEVQGNSLYSAEQVVQASGIETGDNLLTLNKATVAGNIITQLPYVEKVSVGRSMPDAVILEVQESTARFAVMSDTNVIWLINSSGKALERYDGLTDVTAAQTPTDETPVETPAEEAAVETPITETPAGEMPADTAQPEETSADSTADAPADETAADTAADSVDAAPVQTATRETGDAASPLAQTGVPYILGVTVQNPSAGSQVTAVNQQALDAALAVLAEFDGTGLLGHVASINVEKDYNIVVWYDDQYEIQLGGTEKLDYKVQYLLAILEQLSEYQAGTIDLTLTGDDVARFHPRA